MPAFIKTKREEELWARAKRIVTKEYKLTEGDGDKFWRLVNGIYQHMQRGENRLSNHHRGRQ